MGFLSGLFGGGPNPAQLKLANYMQGQQSFNYGQALKHYLSGIGDINTGYNAALGNASLGAGTAKRDVLDLQKQELGANTQMNMNRGLYNTTALNSGQRGVYSDAMRRMADVNTTLASNMASLNMQKANALMGAKSGLANLYGQKSGSEQQLGSMLFQAMPSGGASPLMGALGGLAGAYLGGPLGAQLGSGLLGGGQPQTQYQYQPGHSWW